jgi:uncharacterized protein YegP (UPF0339 family)
MNRPIYLIVRKRWWRSKWYIRFVDSDNGKILAHSENYSGRQAAIDTAQMIALSPFLVRVEQ